MRTPLAPGLRVVRRGTDAVQVGYSPARRVVLPHTPEVVATLDRLLDGDPAEPRDAEVLARLEAAGCLVAPGAAAATRTVSVLGNLGVDPLPMLAAAGLVVAPDRPSSAALVLSVGEPDRATLDPWVRRGADHLVVRLVDGGATIGPLVVPGSTACLRCIDAHDLVGDPHHVEVTARYVQATAGPRRDGVPDLDEPALAHLALAWAVRDLAAHLRGRRPGTLSSTVTFAADPVAPVHTTWQRHPDCGCSWPVLEVPSGKMEA